MAGGFGMSLSLVGALELWQFRGDTVSARPLACLLRLSNGVRFKIHTDRHSQVYAGNSAHASAALSMLCVAHPGERRFLAKSPQGKWGTQGFSSDKYPRKRSPQLQRWCK